MATATPRARAWTRTTRKRSSASTETARQRMTRQHLPAVAVSPTEKSVEQRTKSASMWLETLRQRKLFMQINPTFVDTSIKEAFRRGLDRESLFSSSPQRSVRAGGMSLLSFQSWNCDAENSNERHERQSQNHSNLFLSSRRAVSDEFIFRFGLALLSTTKVADEQRFRFTLSPLSPQVTFTSESGSIYGSLAPKYQQPMKSPLNCKILFLVSPLRLRFGVNVKDAASATTSRESSAAVQQASTRWWDKETRNYPKSWAHLNSFPVPLDGSSQLLQPILLRWVQWSSGRNKKQKSSVQTSWAADAAARSRVEGCAVTDSRSCLDSRELHLIAVLYSSSLSAPAWSYLDRSRSIDRFASPFGLTRMSFSLSPLHVFHVFAFFSLSARVMPTHRWNAD